MKSEPNRVRITVGGDKLDYLFDAGSPAANLLETKVLINSTILDAPKGARFLTADVKDFFLASPMLHPEYMKVHIRHIPLDIQQRYNIQAKATDNGFVYVRIKKECMDLSKQQFLLRNN